MKATKLLTSFVALTTLMLTGCKNKESEDSKDKDKDTPAHKHSWSSEWSGNNYHHWHECSGCDEVNDLAEHTFDTVGFCTVCHRWCGDEITFHQKIEFENIAANSHYYFRFKLETSLKLKREKSGEFSADDIKVYRVDENDQYDVVDIDGMSFKTPAASKTGYYYVVVSPVGTGVAEGSFSIEDDHTQSGNELDVMGFCRHSGSYRGIEVEEFGTTNYYFGDFVGQAEAYIRFLPEPNKAYYLELKNQLSHDLARLDTYANVNGEANGIDPIDYFDPGYAQPYSGTEYYTAVTELNSDGYVYIHWVGLGTTDEEFKADDYFKIMANEAI